MANRCYLYSLNIYPDEMGKLKAIPLSEASYDIPLIYKILLSQTTDITKSLIFDGKLPLALTADYDAGVKKLEEFFAKASNYIDKEKADNILSFLKDPKNRQEYIHLEAAEICDMMICDDDDIDDEYTPSDEYEDEADYYNSLLYECNADLLIELNDIDKEIKSTLKNLKNGDDSELEIMDPDCWTNTLSVEIKNRESEQKSTVIKKPKKERPVSDEDKKQKRLRILVLIVVVLLYLFKTFILPRL